MPKSRRGNKRYAVFHRHIVILTMLAVFTAGCSSDRDQPAPSAATTHPAASNLSATASDTTTGISTSSDESLYSQAPGCNALVKRIAEEMLPCLQRIKPEMAEHLQTTINTFRNGPRLRLDLAERDAVLKQVEENCADYWRQIQHQLDSKAAEGQCLLDADH